MSSNAVERLVVLKHEQRSDILFFEHYFRYMFASQFIKDLKVLDCACGTGYGSYLLAKEAKEVVGIDVDSTALDIANHDWIRENITYLQLDIAHMLSLNKNYDGIVSFETLEHLNDPAGFIENISTMLNKNGIAIISTPNRHAYRRQNGNRPNIYHKIEFTPTEFLSLLSKKFSNVTLFGQISFPESIIVRIYEIVSDHLERLFATNKITYGLYLSYFSNRYKVVQPENIDRYVYMIAVCKK